MKIEDGILLRIMFLNTSNLIMVFKDRETALATIDSLERSILEWAYRKNEPDKICPLVRIKAENGLFSIQPISIQSIILISGKEDDTWCIAYDVRTERLNKAVEQEAQGSIPIGIGSKKSP